MTLKCWTSDRLLMYTGSRSPKGVSSRSSATCTICSATNQKLESGAVLYIVQYSRVQYGTVQHSTLQHSTVQHSPVQYSTGRYSAIQVLVGCEGV